MSKRIQTTIGLFARGKEIGFAVVVNGEMTRYGVKTVTGKRTGADFRHRIASILDALTEAESSSWIILPDKASPGALSRTVLRWAEAPRNAGHVRRVSMNDVKRLICGDPGATHRALSQTVVATYPILAAASAKRDQPKRRVLIAVALAHVGQRRTG
ncbi:MAG: hypothetical protein O3A46_15155 [Candidatus Poribacteria bacterium]|nr:hypothetical protein [Candidatus Poribacteria bacterium]